MKDTFLFQAMIYLAAAVIAVPLAKKLGLGSVLGYLIAGMIIGPACLQFIGKEGQDLMHFAEFGVVMMLFVIGLELEPLRLWRMRRSIAGLGGLQVLLTAVICAGIALLFHIGWKQSLAIGMILSMSSTAIVLQSLNEKGLMKSAAGESSFAVLLFQDIAVIPILAILPLLASDNLLPLQGKKEHGIQWLDSLPAGVQTLIVLGSVAVVVLTGRYFTRPVFRIIAKTGMREMFTATALLLVVGITVLMTAVGLSPALGTFLAGVVLANSEYRHELESDIDPFKGLLLGLFFIAVGASIDFALILSRPLMVFGLVAGIMLLKALVLFILGKAFRLSLAQNFIFSLGLSQVGEFAFVLFSFAFQESILPKEISDIMIAVVAITMALTPLLMMINDRLIQPRICTDSRDTREPDVASEENPVIIAGYGHFGNTVGRFLKANGINTTVLDIDSDNVDFLRKIGVKVYYGDASRPDLLDIAGAHKAKVIVIAINDEEKRLEMIDAVKKHFPHLRMLVRATNRNDAYDLMNAGMLHIYRETLDTSLRMGVDVMRMLGHRAHETTRFSKTFFLQDEKTLKHLSAIRNEEEYIKAMRKNFEDLEATITADREMLALRADDAWETEEG